MEKIINIFNRKNRTKTNIAELVTKPVPRNSNLKNSSFEDCKTFADCMIVASAEFKIRTPSDESFKTYIQESSEQLKHALQNEEETTSRTNSIDVATDKIIQTSSKTATPTKVKASLRRIMGEKRDVVTGTTL